MSDFGKLIEDVGKSRIGVAVANAADEEVLGAVLRAHSMGMIRAILYGDAGLIAKKGAGLDFEGVEIVDCADEFEAIRGAVLAVREGRAGILMKGLVATSSLLKSVLDRGIGFRGEGLMSHVGVFALEGREDFLLMSDGALNIAPRLEQKVEIIRNAVGVSRALGIKEAFVGCLCAIEFENEAMPSTIDAGKLSRMDREVFDGALVSGPLALDNALFLESALHKGIKDPAAGRCNILLVPHIEVGNVLYKSLNFIAGVRGAGVVVGAKSPIILTSRADDESTKLRSIALAVRLVK